ncbi:hypothetical protein [Flavobacterium taihuense]|uniref:Uncharacterized protein n=1 Tax=Flavobacterium taihuense TaxID=2857508 RepID=A0ABS6XZD8_9FLAO|nr:hypothetical protein [Flavobacterium taihuense]MBW4362046.1 hypothetical protein [Flavobacterium taihuense]
MKKLKFLVIGKNEAILEVLVRLLNTEKDWTAEGFMDENQALSVSDFSKFDILLLSCGIEETIEQLIREKAIELNPTLIIIQHYGGGSGLLKNEILSALAESGRQIL